MGWSCSAAAAKVEKQWEEFCLQQSGSQNVYTSNEIQYIIEIDRIEHADGAITGYIVHMQSGEKAGRFKIGGDGRIVAAPPTLRKAAGQW